MYPYNNAPMFEPMYKRGGFRGSPRGGRGRGGGSWDNQGGGGGGGRYYGGGQMDGYRGGGRGGSGGGGYRGGRGGTTGGGYRNNDGGGYRGGAVAGGGGGGYRGNYRGGMQQGGGYQGRGGGSYHTGGGGYQGRGARGGGVMTGGYRGTNYRGGMDQNRGGMNRPNNSTPYKKSDVVIFEESLDFDQRKRMVKLSFDNRIQRADFEELIGTEGVIDLHISGHMFADYKQDDEDVMLQTFQEVESITQNGIPCYADLMGKRSKNFGKEGVRDLKRVDVRNLPEKTTIETVKEAFPGALAVWKNPKFNFIELLFANEEEACEAILAGQQKEINGVLPYVMFHRENMADLTKRPREDDTTQQPPAKKVKKDVDVEAEKENGEGGDEEEEGQGENGTENDAAAEDEQETADD